MSFPVWRHSRTAMVICAAAAALPASAPAADCDTRPAGVAYLPPPYSVTALRETLTAGLAVVARMESAVMGGFHRRVAVESVGADEVRFSQTTLEPAVREMVADGPVSMSFEELRDYGCFPADSATRERATMQTAFGELEGWRYEVAGADARMMLFFADEYPGLPMASERSEGELVLFTMRQVARSDATPAEPGENTPGNGDRRHSSPLTSREDGTM